MLEAFEEQDEAFANVMYECLKRIKELQAMVDADHDKFEADK